MIAPTGLSPDEAARLIDGRHDDPFAVLGPHLAGGGLITRCLIPEADRVAVLTWSGKAAGSLTRTHEGGLFEGKLRLKKPQKLRYLAGNAGGEWLIGDAYSFGPVLGPLDDYYFAEGSHRRLFDRMGAHLLHHEGALGMHFAVWAPNARRVSVVGDFNGWDGRRHVLRLRKGAGVWEIFIPDIGAGLAYKFEILGPDGTMLPLKADPFAFQAELRPANASLTATPLVHEWGDRTHRDFWRNADPRRLPISIYEVHAGSWRRTPEDGFLNWDQLAQQLIPYVVEMGFTHIEFLPITEHPLDASWGYQVIGLYAPTARFGPPEAFARFVDGAHRAGIGVILDWVPAHFPTDSHGLARFDGTALYEHEDPRRGFQPDWNTAIYNFGRREVSAFLVNNALFWVEKYHLDGLRVDAVASMLYLDYSRKPGEWLANPAGGRENLEAVAFLKEVNQALTDAHPGMISIAEESTAWPNVSRPVADGGLGFGFKWNMGFMNDTLRYLAHDPVYRSRHHDDITFGLLYAFSENFVLPLSHDEVVHGKGTLLGRMPGDDSQKFANLRAYYGFMWGYPGKKLLFMGQEFAQRDEWNESRALDWQLLDQPAHHGMRRLLGDLNRLYRTCPALHEWDCDQAGFSWSVADDRLNSVFAWLRFAPDAAPIAVIVNFTQVARHFYALSLPRAGPWREILNTDATIYGGGGIGNNGRVVAAADGRVEMTLPPLAAIMLEHEAEEPWH